ncbi:MAG: formate dehydrogenase subunit delta, partial [Porticoccaceae bacterium]|nr:formate dehydrogenase subunit delta [Porticoccaceae bacterium]
NPSRVFENRPPCGLHQWPPAYRSLKAEEYSMSESKIERLVSMVNQIALNMSANGSDKMVADQVAQHLEKFWSPPMKNLITEQPADADIGLTPIGQLAVQNLLVIQEAKRA